VRALDAAERLFEEERVLDELLAQNAFIERFNQTGYALAAQWDALSRLDVGAALGRYNTVYGVSRWEWYRSVTVSVRVSSLSLGTRYHSTRLGVGSGFGVSLGYEPAGAGSRELSAP
jgi:hypothetical protein